MCPLVSLGLKCAAKIHVELQFSLVPGLQFIKGMAESNNRALEKRPSLLRSVTPTACPLHSGGKRIIFLPPYPVQKPADECVKVKKKKKQKRGRGAVGCPLSQSQSFLLLSCLPD